MGQKIRPDSYRLGIFRDWVARWFPRKRFKDYLEEDLLIRKIIQEKIGAAGITKIEIERNANAHRIFIKAARPGLVIGRGGKGIELLSQSIEGALKKLFKDRGKPQTAVSLSLNVEELKRSEISAVNVAQNIAADFERRMPFRRTIKKYLENIMQNREVLGGKIRVSGRLDGGEIARREWLSKGSLPLQTLRANIDYGESTAFCAYGTVGIKVWIYKGEIFTKK
ncbi:MAG: 30S ribosomal protein S3 [Candidatus Harrisonbacteria bacterium RIFCSPHIGHO2_01_FULL_44_13]|uniref:Small ribosomal subunit protein uS3 n=1 Tax=Candidatus Harrisonbacteria bacterium RIFCSPLOWO2_01_FULL_44_18 TaxID=1798407 RepID=A0A1G1ZQB7_9BACT|nr:MAG: 30S ribosomal protein S3 [Candidatus Harrisonbacteria bacterium RIFCSPHIGHO2_01_FULL_44_13]OGY65950.1 MAG: 30S ribosomal protein S3 [Candidatus Harrisonbacteria bacterium RIFCSPLOWO2_01_FULL_44_18]